MSTSPSCDFDLMLLSSACEMSPNSASPLASSSQTLLQVDLLVRSEKRLLISLLPYLHVNGERKVS